MISRTAATIESRSEHADKADGGNPPLRSWLAGIILLSHAPLVVQHFSQLWQFRPHYEFFPFVLLAVAYLAWQRWPQGVAEQSRLTIVISRLMLAMGMVMLTAAVLLFSPWLGTIAAIFSIGSFALAFAGKAALPSLLPVWLLLWIVIPPPVRLDDDLTRALQSTTAQTASGLLERVGVPHVLMGNVVHVPGREFFVAEACSGIHSQLLLIAACLIFTVVTRRSIAHTIALTLAAVFWSAAVNILRVTMIVFLADRFDIDLSTGWPHEVLGFALLGVGCLLLVSTDRFLCGILGPVLSTEFDAKSEGDGPPLARDPLSRVWNFAIAQIWAKSTENKADSCDDTDPPKFTEHTPSTTRSHHVPQRSRLRAVALTGFAMLGLVQILMLSAPSKVTLDPGRLASEYSVNSLPSELVGWRQVNYLTQERERGSNEGQCSRIWAYQNDTSTDLAHVSVDFPFKGWHELTNCYKGLGWREVSRRLRTIPAAPGDSDAQVVEVHLEKPTGEIGFLQFSLFDGAGRTIAPQSSNWKGWDVKLAASPVIQFVRNGTWGAGTFDTTIQFQQFVQSEHRLGNNQLQELRELYGQMRHQFHQETFASDGD